MMPTAGAGDGVRRQAFGASGPAASPWTGFRHRGLAEQSAALVECLDACALHDQGRRGCVEAEGPTQAETAQQLLVPDPDECGSAPALATTPGEDELDARDLGARSARHDGPAEAPRCPAPGRGQC
jgi:hypothetical protein